MTDFLGQEISIGDRVLYIVKYGNYTKFSEGEVVSFGEGYTEILGKDNSKPGKVLSHRVIKKPLDEKVPEYSENPLNVACTDRCSVLQLEDLEDTTDTLISFSLYKYYHEYQGLNFTKRLKIAWQFLTRKSGLLSFEFIANREGLLNIYNYLKSRLYKPLTK
mgnify:CR=1 FL=1